jgi:excisionase family DNA binding protein
MADVNPERLLTVPEVAKLLRLSEYTVYKWARTGRIPCQRYRHVIRFKLSDIERWQARHTFGNRNL